jgi:adenine phosphoribosyltransferase
MHTDSISEWEKIAIVDDLLATGWTARAAIDLIEQSGGIVDSLNFVIILDELNWIAKLEWHKVNSLVSY